jgi:hypothetical protein
MGAPMSKGRARPEIGARAVERGTLLPHVHWVPD